jgi:hypothetical protein
VSPERWKSVAEAYAKAKRDIEDVLQLLSDLQVFLERAQLQADIARLRSQEETTQFLLETGDSIYQLTKKANSQIAGAGELLISEAVLGVLVLTSKAA